MKYRDFKNDTWDKVLVASKNKRVILFAYNEASKKLIDENRFSPIYIVDNDSNKWEAEYKGVCVKSPDALKQIKDEVMVIICSIRIADISLQLESLGVRDYYSQFWLDREVVFYEQKADYKKVDALKAILSDDKSKDLVDSIVEKRNAGFMDYTDIKEWGKSEYFSKEFWNPVDNETFIDGGAYDGDTIEEFIKWTDGSYKKIYSFEPQADKYEEAKSRIIELKSQERVELFDLGLWSEKTQLRFKNGDDDWSGTVNSEDYDVAIKTCAIDEVVDEAEKITFLKLDIEGAETEALLGAKKHIVKDRPRMAICIYHKLDDLWTIPQMIYDWLPDYELYIRHHGMRHFGTILYAKPK